MAKSKRKLKMERKHVVKAKPTAQERRISVEQREFWKANRRNRKRAAQMRAKYLLNKLSDPIQLMEEYWQARRCGWEMCGWRLARTKKEKPCEPAKGASWRWWRKLHWKQRLNLEKMSKLPPL